MSDARAALMRKISKLSSDIGFVEFDAKNTGQNYGYASAAGVIRTINKRMAEVGLAMTCESELLHFSIQQDPTKNRLVSYAVVKETVRIFDVDTGEYISTSGTGSGVDYGDKAQYKASTGAFKYCLAHVLCLGWGAEDPEADASSDNIGKEEPASALGAPISVAAIRAAKTADELADLKPKVLARKGKKGYDELVAAFKTREGQVK